MDMLSWKNILMRWITECGFLERNNYNLEQTDIEVFYQNFSIKHKTVAVNKSIKHLSDFLKEHYPCFKINYNDENGLSSADYMYAYSLLLHFCCVKFPETVFHEICKRLSDLDQQCIAAFFKELLEAESVTKEVVRHAIAAVGNVQNTPPRLNDSFINTIGVGGINSASFSRSISPLKTPKRCVGPQRISPNTPKSYLLEERTRELYNLRASLETERYEKGLLEVQIKQSEDEIKKLNNDYKRLQHQIQDLKNEIFVADNDGSTNHDSEENKVQIHILKEMSHKEEEILKLSCNVRTLRDEKTLVEEKLINAERKIIVCINRIKELELKVEESTEEIKEKDDQIKYLTDNKHELEQFILETRSASANPDLNSSNDFVDNSFLRNNNSSSSNSISSPENLGASVVDVKLKEKELENQQLKEELKYVRSEHTRLANNLTKLTKEYHLPIDTISTVSPEDSVPETEVKFCEGNSVIDYQIIYKKQFNIFSSCVDEIDKFRKTEKNKIKQLELQTCSLQKENAILSQKLSDLKQEMADLNEKLSAKENSQKEFERIKQNFEFNLQKSQNNVIEVEKLKDKLCIEIESLKTDNEKLNQHSFQLKTNLELEQQKSKEILTNNKKLLDCEQDVTTRLHKVDKEFSCMATKWAEEENHLTEKLTKQLAEIELYKQSETTIKYNNEQLVVQNEDLKKEARQNNIYLKELRKNLNEKEMQLTLFGKEISEFKKNNEMLEKNISFLMGERKKELLITSSAQTELDEQLGKLRERLSKTEQLMASKQHECELTQRRLLETETKIKKTLQYFIDFNEDKASSDSLDIIKAIQVHIENEMVHKEKLKSQVVNLQDSLKESFRATEKLTAQLKEKCQEHESSQVKLFSLQAENLAIENKVSELKQQQFCILERSNINLQEKEQEFHNRLKEVSAEYDASLERIADELKSEKEHCNNKEMELILFKAEISESKKMLKKSEIEIEQLHNEKLQLKTNCERLKGIETRMIECSAENEKLRNEIQTFKNQVKQNAFRVLEADKALSELVKLAKKRDSAKDEADILQNKLKKKDKALLEIEFKLQQQTFYEEQIQDLKQQLNKQPELTFSLQDRIEKLDKFKNRLLKLVAEKDQQILKEQQDKLLLLNSVEKTTDQFKLIEEESQQQKSNLEEKLKNLTQQLDLLICKNAKLQGDLVERKAELRLVLDEQQQEKENFQQKLSLQKEILCEKSDQLEIIEQELIEISATIENKFNPSEEFEQNNDSDVFNCQETKSTKHIQKLKKHLNNIVLKQKNFDEKFKEISSQKEEAVISLVTLQRTYNDLVVRLNQQEKYLKKTQELLQNKELIVEKKVFKEVKRLEEDLLNLEKVNECLANENLKIQVSLGNMEQQLKDSKIKAESHEDKTLYLKEEIRKQTSIITNLQIEYNKLQKSINEKCQQLDKMYEKCKNLEAELKDKTTKLENLEKEIKEKANRNQQELFNYEYLHVENKNLQENLKLCQSSHDSLDFELENTNKEYLEVKNKNFDLLQHKNREQQQQLALQKLDEVLTIKLNDEIKCDQLQSEIYQLRLDLDLTKAQQQEQHENNNRLNQEIESLKEDKHHLSDEIYENKLTLQRANENVSQLMQQVSSIRLEKEAAVEENILVRKQLEETDKTKNSLEEKINSVIKKSKDSERIMLSAENELKSLKANLEKSECYAEKLQLENKKLRDNQEISTKRVEKLALKLGDSQAKSSKLERDNEKIGRTLKAHGDSIDALKKEKDFLQSEAKSLKERLSRAERGHEQLVVKVQNLEHQNTDLLKIKQKLEASDIDCKAKLNKLEKMREVNEEKLRKLSNSLNNAENENVKLNLEIGALNSQLQEIRVDQNHEQTRRIEELNKKLLESRDLQHKYEEINEKLKIEINTVKGENFSLHENLSKASLSIKITSQECERFAAEMEKLRAEILILRHEKTQVEQQYENAKEKLNQFESQSTQIAYQNDNIIKTLQQKISNLEEKLAIKSEKVFDLEKQIELTNKHSEYPNSSTHQNTITELKDLHTKISLTEDLRLKDQQIISQLRLDNEILHTKYQESKQRVLEATKTTEERIKENRLELEAKLEKMKNKMKNLYTEETSKMKTKQDRELTVLKSGMEVLKNQNGKYEEHIRKLSNQIVRLNDNILHHQKNNTILSTKLQHLADLLKEVERIKRTSSIHISSTSLSKTSVPGPNIGANFTMEDEEGEVFNNTYLTDMKNGRMPELNSRDVCLEELKYRNSLLPPHLRSSYAALFDHEFPEDELKDGPHILDDSMSALLSTTAGGTRKKCTGITHYKRPGPPTPSKNGRLSFGGSSEPAREILKESHDVNVESTASSSKTPARFNFFASRFSMVQTRDEKHYTKAEPTEFNPQKIVQNTKIMNIAAPHMLSPKAVCTSTPRKSKVHFDQRRLLDQIMKTSHSSSPLTVDNKWIAKGMKLRPPDISIIETPITALDRHNTTKAPIHKTIAKRLEAIAGGLKRYRRYSSLFGRRLSRRIQEICTPRSGETTSSALSTPNETKYKTKKEIVVLSSNLNTSGGPSKTTLLQRRLLKKSRKEKEARPSLHFSGNMFAKYRPPTKKEAHVLNQHKSRKQRFHNFNKHRNIKSFILHDETDEAINGNTVKDITYELKNKGCPTFNQTIHMGETVVMGKRLLKNQELVEETFTFGEEQFEYQTGESEYDNRFENCAEEFGDGKDNNSLFTQKRCKLQLVSSQDLEEFDRLIANRQIDSHSKKQEHNYSFLGSSEHFEKLLTKTNSSAPFEVGHLEFNVKKSYSSNSQCSSISNSSQYSQSQMDSQNEHGQISLITATPITSASHLSRTIYGGTIIYNHRLPNISTTYGRKSSIYVKSRRRKSQQNVGSSSCNDVVLITDQTITLVDIICMWTQMDSSTRIIITFAVLASFTTLCGLCISLCARL